MALGDYNPQGNPYGTTDAQTLWQYLEKMPPEQRETIIQNLERQGDPRAEQLRGMNEIGMGDSSGTSREGRAGAMYGENIADAKDIQDQVDALGMEDYTYDPAQEQGAGYQLVDQIEHAGAFDPYQAKLQDEAINQTRTDTTGVDAQRGVLGEYANLYAQGGLSAIDRARMAQARQQRMIQNRGAQGAIMARAEQMGRAGGNAELLSRLTTLQGSQNALAQDDMQTNALALERRDALLRDRASLGGRMQEAQDAIDAFNTLGERDRVRQNIDRENRAGEINFDERNVRDRNFTSERNAAHTTQFGEDSARDSRNTDRTNEARRFNVGPNQGRRGQVRDRAEAGADVRNARTNAAEHLKGIQAKDDATAGAQTAAIASALGQGGEFGLQAYQTFKSDGKDKDEDEDE